MRVIIFGGIPYLDNEQKNVIVNLPLAELEPFPNHPFAVRMDEQMVQLVESVERVGVLSPAIVREVNGKYQLVAGHRRKKACELKGKYDGYNHDYILSVKRKCFGRE